jgi:hypothetical protein
MNLIKNILSIIILTPIVLVAIGSFKIMTESEVEKKERELQILVAKTCFQGSQWKWSENLGSFLKNQPEHCFIEKS